MWMNFLRWLIGQPDMLKHSRSHALRLILAKSSKDEKVRGT